MERSGTARQPQLLGQKKDKFWLTVGLCALTAALFFLPFYIIDGGFFHYAGDFNSQQISFYLLEGRKATAHAGFQDKLAGAEVLDTEVVVDGNITTSYGLGGAIPFALELVRQLAGQAEADRIQNAIAYRH